MGSACTWPCAAKTGGGIDGPGLGLMEWRRLKLWLNHAFGELASIKP